MADTAAAPERTLPHNLDAEKSVLGAILIHNEAFNHAAELIDSRDFFRDAHRRIFDKMVALSERNDAIDFVTLKEELSRSGELEEVGGPAYIASLADGVPRQRQRRALRAHRQGEVDAAQPDPLGQPDPRRRLRGGGGRRTCSSTRRSRRSSRSPRTGSAPGFVPLRDLVQSSFATIEKLQQHKGLVTGVPTGFVDLDEMTSGLQPSDLVLVAARPSMGKTSFVLNIAQHVGTQTDMTVGFFSLEMSKEQLFMRMLTSEARIDAHRFRSGYLNEKDYGRLSHALGTLAEARVFIDDTASIGVLEMRAKARRLQGRARPPPAHHRLHPADAGPRPLREPPGGARVDLAVAEGAGEGAERPDRRAVAAVARAGDALGSPPAALRPARVGRARAGRRRRHVHLPRGAVPRRRRPAEPGSGRAPPRSSSASSATARSAP